MLTAKEKSYVICKDELITFYPPLNCPECNSDQVHPFYATSFSYCNSCNWEGHNEDLICNHIYSEIELKMMEWKKKFYKNYHHGNHFSPATSQWFKFGDKYKNNNQCFYCPNCGSNHGRMMIYMNIYEWAECLGCGWKGNNEDLFESNEEYINSNRSKKLKEILYDKNTV
jgi:hypothetical protein